MLRGATQERDGSCGGEVTGITAGECVPEVRRALPLPELAVVSRDRGE